MLIYDQFEEINQDSLNSPFDEEAVQSTCRNHLLEGHSVKKICVDSVVHPENENMNIFSSGK